MKRLAARALLFAFCTAGFVPGTSVAAGVQVQTETGPAVLTKVARGLENPWSLAFLPDGRMLVTERPGRMRLVSPSGELSAPLAGLPAVHASGQGGLLDVVLSPGFATDRLIYFSFAQPTAGGARTAVARARLD
ncbi:MAG: PQQ-dependent sugar dehydrogenase, partial [Proteobacteria bacterium]|nr:PQQ-dependent sugar dehydrogenase [Pseudomonadota bacterium]